MTYDFLMKLGIALLLGLIIGMDRQLKHKPLGVKTSMVISVASCLITIVSIESVHRFSLPGHTNMDPLRLAAQIVSGVGFLGAGVILRRSNDVISGLTTASMVWAASGLGIAVGAGFYFEATTAAILIILAINLFPLLLRWVGPRSLRQRDLSIKIVVDGIGNLDDVFKQIKHLNLQVKRVKVKDVDNGQQKLEMMIISSEDTYTTDIYSSLKTVDHVISVEVESR
ncbi:MULTISPECIES: MgtC/SapB family protein [Brevibacillus]|uniref:MgtC/SapB family protein n=2 Tax=Brevibacillus TaxID=55080 RepID=A0A3M8CW34_9BACL|nr:MULTISPECIES: MgtC/SapB family protein [Brevibacillus]MDR7315778.1 putative Mg2+ transporter-C (MgtC) family protein [Brevibacillus nitrificans]MEC2127502.1 MgtC/SapB family protein [Brevibacillus centrosporus]MED1795540.1 MgtC/SapB family protein [Brevibacillus nitrificans]MED1952080.1 MgtC/SapB family protein [Brevibacillus centrosporus]MED4910489.1 MgtC/SapB family protein [Brevibacillus centrosporus]